MIDDGGTRAPFRAPPAAVKSDGLSVTVYLAAGADLPARLASEANVEAWVRQQLPRLSMSARDALLKQLPAQRVFAFTLSLELAGVVELTTRPV